MNPLQVQCQSAPAAMVEPFVRERQPNNRRDQTPHPTTLRSIILLGKEDGWGGRPRFILALLGGRRNFFHRMKFLVPWRAAKKKFIFRFLAGGEKKIFSILGGRRKNFISMLGGRQFFLVAGGEIRGKFCFRTKMQYLEKKHEFGLCL